MTHAPHKEEAEQCLLGCLLLDPITVMDLCHREKITPEHFYVPAHRKCFELCYNFAAQNGAKHINLPSLADYARKEGSLDRVGGSLFLDGLVDRTPTSQHAGYFADQVKQTWLRRCVIENARMAEAIAQDEDSGTEALAKAQALFINIDSQRRVTDPSEIWEAVYQGWVDADNGDTQGVPSPFPRFDAATGGLPRGLSIAFAGVMDSRKSYILANWALHLGMNGIPGGYFCFEDGNKRTMGRMVAMHAKVSAFHLMLGKASHRLPDVKKSGPIITSLPIGWHGERDQSTNDIDASIARGVAKYGWQWVFLDGFKDIKRNYKASRLDEDDRRSNALADMAERYNVALLSVHHITKAAGKEQKENQKTLLLQDLKGSGGILDDSRMVIFAQKKETEDGDEYALDCQKTNHGQKGYVRIYLVDENTGAFTQDDPRKEVPEEQAEQEAMPF